MAEPVGSDYVEDDAAAADEAFTGAWRRWHAAAEAALTEPSGFPAMTGPTALGPEPVEVVMVEVVHRPTCPAAPPRNMLDVAVTAGALDVRTGKP